MTSRDITTISIQGTDLQRVEYKGAPVVTFAQVDQVHERPEGTAGRNFRENRKRFHKGEDFIKICADEIRRHKIIPLSPKAHEDITFLTRRGYLKLVKTMNDDRAWEVQGEMIDRYFMVEQARSFAIPQSLPEALRLAADLAEKVELVSAERDHAIATKSQISRTREASAMGKASAAVRQVNRLKKELGHNSEYATVKAVHNVTGAEYAWRPMRRWCLDNGRMPGIVPDPLYGEVKAWPAEAWKAVHGVDLTILFAVPAGEA